MLELPNADRFSVKNSYLANNGEQGNGLEQIVWKNLWKSNLHDRLQVFFWRPCVGVLAVKFAIRTITGSGETSRSSCNDTDETLVLSFLDCPQLLQGWLFDSKWCSWLEE